MPITHRPPPVAAQHEVEVRAAQEDYAIKLRRGVEDWVHKIAYGRSRWLMATASTAGGGIVTASDNDSSTPFGARSGTGIVYTTGAVSNKKWWVVEHNDGKSPAPTIRALSHGLRIATMPKPHEAPARIIRPTVPELTHMPDATESEVVYIRKWATPGAELLWYWLRFLLKREVLDTFTWWVWGTVSDVNVSAKRATVRVEASATDLFGPEISAGWGTRVWTFAQLAGKRVRVGVSQQAAWIDDIDAASGRIRNVQ